MHQGRGFFPWLERHVACIEAVIQNPGWLGYIGDYKLPSFIGIICVKLEGSCVLFVVFFDILLIEGIFEMGHTILRLSKMTKITPFITSRGLPCRESVFFLLGVSMRKDSNNIEKKKNIGKILGQGKSLPSTFEKESHTNRIHFATGNLPLLSGFCSNERRLVVNSSSGWLIGLP